MSLMVLPLGEATKREQNPVLDRLLLALTYEVLAHLE